MKEVTVYVCPDCPKVVLMLAPLGDAPWCDHAWYDGDEMRPFVKNASKMEYFGKLYPDANA